MPTYVPRETTGSAISGLRVPVSGKDSSGIARAFSLDAGGQVFGTNATGSQADGHSLTLGTTADPETSGTIVGRIRLGNSYLLQIVSHSLPDNGPFVDGTSRVVPAGFVFDQVAGTALTENDVAAARIDAKRSVVFVLEDGTTRGQVASVSGSRLNVNLDAWLGSSVPAIGQKSMTGSIPVVIASDQTSIPTGIQGDVDAGRVFSVAQDVNMASAGSDNPLVLLRNPSGSNKTAYFYTIQGGTNVANVSAVFRFFSNPSITTTGSLAIVAKRKIGSSVDSVITASTLPTVSSTGTRLSGLVTGQNSNSVIFGEGFATSLPPGFDALITGSPSSNNRNAVITVAWLEK